MTATFKDVVNTHIVNTHYAVVMSLLYLRTNSGIYKQPLALHKDTRKTAAKKNYCFNQAPSYQIVYQKSN